MELNPSYAPEFPTTSVSFSMVRRTTSKKKRRKPTKRKRGTNVGDPIHPGMLDRFTRVMDAARIGAPVDLGPPRSGTIRILVPAYESRNYNSVPYGQWFHAMIHSHDRTISEWKQAIDDHKRPILGASSAFAWREAHAAEMEKIVYKNMRIRNFFRYWLSLARKRIMDKHVIGDVDLYTMDTIPDHFAVRVYDIATLRSYVFHLNTILRTILSSLNYNSYAVACPQAPKNPYTNINWTTGQLIRILDQCAHYKLRAHSFLPSIIVSFREHKYDVKRLYVNNAYAMNIAAATSFFSNHIDPVVMEMYIEVYDDLSSIITEKKGAWNIIRTMLGQRKLSAELLKQWDAIIIIYWLFNTFHFVASTYMKTIQEVDDELLKLYGDTYTWCSANVRIQRRVKPSTERMVNSPALTSTPETITHE